MACCMAQHFKEELLKEIPEIKGLVGSGDYQKIAKVLIEQKKEKSLKKFQKSRIYCR